MCRRKYNKNSKVYCIISVCSFFCSKFEVLYFIVTLRSGLQVERWGYGMVGILSRSIGVL